MITPAYVQTLARYSTWQNNQLIEVVQAMEQADLDADRGAFFGSIQRTLSHLLWADLLWMSRFDARCRAPEAPMARSAEIFADKTDWATERFLCDGRTRIWAEGLRRIDLQGDLNWYSAALVQELSRPLGVCITHFFNHQTHHRGQIHGMLTAAGQQAPVSDLIIMPQED